jgi:signal transduction histidine kinase
MSSVADDGPGIPEMEIEVLESGEETPLAHSSGIGLWLVNWLTDHLNGQISFENREPRGSIVTVRLPKPDPDELDASPRVSGEAYTP